MCLSFLFSFSFSFLFFFFFPFHRYHECLTKQAEQRSHQEKEQVNERLEDFFHVLFETNTIEEKKILKSQLKNQLLEKERQERSRSFKRGEEFDESECTTMEQAPHSARGLGGGGGGGDKMESEDAKKGSTVNDTLSTNNPQALMMTGIVEREGGNDFTQFESLLTTTTTTTLDVVVCRTATLTM